MEIYHYTDRAGYDSIKAGVDWCFKAHQPPPRDHPLGAYFTVLGPATKRLANRLRISKSKTAYVFVFVDIGDLVPLRGDRGQYIFYSATDYVVGKDRQVDSGESAAVESRRR